MNDLISRQALYEKTAEWEAQALHMVEITMNDEDLTEWRKWSIILKERGAFKFDIADAPSAERKGKWINHRNDAGHNIADCSVCGSAIQWFDDDEKPRFCCMCGSRNKQEEKE